jgi:hypothetical protein
MNEERAVYENEADNIINDAESGDADGRAISAAFDALRVQRRAFLVGCVCAGARGSAWWRGVT